MRYPEKRKPRTGDRGTLEERKAYYDSRLKCPHCFHCQETRKGGKDGWKTGLNLSFKNKWKLLGHYNNNHLNLLGEIQYLFSEKEIVICPLCNAMLGQIGHKHLAAHNLTTEEFKKRFPDAGMRPDKMKKVWSDRCKEFNKTEYMREHVSSSLLEGHKNGKYDEIKEEASKKKKEKFASGEIIVWNKGLNKNDHPSIMSTSDKFRKMWAERRMSSGAKIKGYFYSKKNKKEIPYRSTYELKAFQILEEDANVKKYDYEKIRVRYRDKNYKLRSYYPDIVTSDKRVIEVKSQWIFEKQNKEDDVFRKFAAAEKWAQKNGYTFEVWTEKELKM